MDQPCDAIAYLRRLWDPLTKLEKYTVFLPNFSLMGAKNSAPTPNPATNVVKPRTAAA